MSCGPIHPINRERTCLYWFEPEGSKHSAGRLLLRRSKGAGLGPAPFNPINYGAELSGTIERWCAEERTETYGRPSWAVRGAVAKTRPIKASRATINLDPVI